jgi:photosystem II stability/assembly factor-like uncharacterized protein
VERWLVSALWVACAALALPVRAADDRDVGAPRRRAVAYGQIPLHFEPNQGQADRSARFITVGSGYAIALAPGESILKLASSQGEPGFELRTTLVGATVEARLEGRDPLSGRSNYFIGNDPKRWQTRIPHYGRVACEGVYPGIDVVYYGNQRQIEHDFVVAPGADPTRIRLDIAGATSVRIDDGGDLVLTAAGREVVQRAPVLYQEAGQGRQAVRGRYVLRGRHEVGFEVGDYDRTRPLVIDPVLVFSTYVGGNAYDWGHGIVVDSTGAAYVVGTTLSTDFRLVSPVEPLPTQEWNVFVAKLDPTGTSFVYSTLLGGSGGSNGAGIAVDSNGSAYVTGDTGAMDFPLQDPIFGPAPTNQTFVTKLDQTGGGLVYSTFLGGSSSDVASGIAVDPTGAAYVTGTTNSWDYPTLNAFRTTYGGFPDPQYGQYDGFLTKINPAGNALVYSTYFGGSDVDRSRGVAADAQGNAIIVGTTGSADLPVQAAVQSHLGGTAIYKSLNGGATWAPSGTGLDARRVYAICVDPANANLVLAGTSRGLYRSTDGGATWTRHPTLSFGSVMDVVAIAGSPTRFLAASSGTVLWQSTDGGATWSAVLNGSYPLPGTFLTKIAKSPATTQRLYAAASGGDAMYRSTDGGATWTQASSFPGSAEQSDFRTSTVAVDASDPGTVYSALNHGLIYKTTDGGDTWTLSSNGIPTTPPFVGHIVSLAAHPSLPGTVFAGTEVHGVYRSVDGGNSWTAIRQPPETSPDYNVYALAFSGGSPAALYAAATRGLYKSTDLGNSWSRVLDIAYTAHLGASIRAVAADPAHPAVVFAGLELSPDAFVAKFDPVGGLVYATYLGGKGDDSANGVAIDGDGAAYLTGSTGSSDFPTQAAYQSSFHGSTDAFVTKLDPSGATAVYSTYLGGSTVDDGNGITVDDEHRAYVVGDTQSQDFPQSNPLQAGPGSSMSQAFLTRLDPDGSTTTFSTTIGGWTGQANASPMSLATGVAVDSAGGVYVAGTTTTVDFPAACGPQPLNPIGGTYDAFVLKVGDPTRTANLAVTVDDGRSMVVRGDMPTFTIQVFNLGPDDVPSATVTNILPAASLEKATWTCAAVGGAACTAQGTGEIHDGIVIPVGGLVTYQVTATIPFSAPQQDILETVSVQGCGVDDPDSSNNRYTDRDSLLGPSFAVSDVSVIEGDSGTRTATVTVSHTGIAYPYTIDYTTADGTASAGADYVAASGTLTFPNDATSSEIAIPVKGDVLAEGDERFFVRISNPMIGVIYRGQGAVTIVDDDFAGTFDLAAGIYSIPEYAGKATVSVRRTGSNAAGATVHYATIDGSATADSDYTGVRGTLTFGANVGLQSFTIPILNDARAEGPETVLVSLSSPGGPGATLGPQRSAVVTIVDDDHAGQVQFAAARYDVSESAPSAAITVVRSGTAGPATVDYSTADGSAVQGSDYGAVSGTLVFAAGEVVKTFVVPVIEDGLAEGLETLSVQLGNPTGGLTLGPRASATLAIAEDEPAIAFDTAAYAVKESAGVAVVRVRRFGSLAGAAQVSYTTSDGSASAGVDYATAAGTLTFAPGVSIRTFSIVVKPDAIVEGAETVQIALSGGAGASLAAPSTAVLTILDDDIAGTVQFASGAFAAAEDVGRATIRVTRRGGYAGGVVVAYSTNGVTAQAGIDYTETAGLLTFGPAAMVQTFSVSIANDTIAEGPETVGLTLSVLSGGATLGNPSQAILTIQDDEPMLDFAAAEFKVGESAPAATIVVRRSGRGTEPVSVAYHTGGGTATAGDDYQAVNGILSFAPGVLLRTFTVPIRQDAIPEGTEDVGLVLDTPSTGAAIGAIATATLHIVDDEPVVWLAPASYSVSEAAVSASVTVRRSGALALPVEVDYATGDVTATGGSDYTGIWGTLTFGPGIASRTLTIPVAHDSLDEADESFEVRLTAPLGATLGAAAIATVTIRDDDTAGTIQFAQESYSGSEDDGVVHVTLTRTGGAASEASVGYSVVGGTATVSADCDLPFVPVTFAAGQTTASFDVVVHDDGVHEGSEYLTLVLGTAAGGAKLGVRTTATLWIVDND